VIFEADPILTQSLNFEYGSEQEVHQNTAFVITNSPLKLAGIWIALEDIQPGSGELVYYPGSHAWPDYLFSGRFKHFDKERDGIDQLHAWFAWIHAEAQRRDVALQAFLPKKGDALLWHAGIAHGGSPITLPNATRRSLVGHYCPVGTRPLYHYYKPGQRRVYEALGYRYTTSYYP
jgi:ectoine hydroxylase-related dioxygenase (phytanoyl-CoA dioxygenase family)